MLDGSVIFVIMFGCCGDNIYYDQFLCWMCYILFIYLDVVDVVGNMGQLLDSFFFLVFSLFSLDGCCEIWMLMESWGMFVDFFWFVMYIVVSVGEYVLINDIIVCFVFWGFGVVYCLEVMLMIENFIYVF